MYAHLRWRDALWLLVVDGWPVILLVLVVAGSMAFSCWSAP